VTGLPILDADISAKQVGPNEAGFAHDVSSASGSYSLQNLDTSSANDPGSATYSVEALADGIYRSFKRYLWSLARQPLWTFN
jgi:hypothetical protein